MCSPRKSNENFSIFTFYESKQTSLPQDLKWSLKNVVRYKYSLSAASNWFVTLYYIIASSIEVTFQTCKSHNPTCKICGEEAEDRLHFILRCKALEANRRHHIKKICSILNESYSSDTVHNIVSNQLIMLQVILDCTHKSLQSMVVAPQISTLCDIIEPASRLLCYSLHVKRSSLLKVYAH